MAQTDFSGPVYSTYGYLVGGADWTQCGLNTRSGYYFGAQIVGSTFASTVANGALQVTPVRIDRMLNCDRLGVYVQTLSTDPNAVIRLGVYADDGGGAPSTLLIDGGVVPVGSQAGNTNGVKEVVINFVAVPPVIWLAACIQSAPANLPAVLASTQNATPQIGRLTPASGYGDGYQVLGIQGSLPSVLSSPTLITTALRAQVHAV